MNLRYGSGYSVFIWAFAMTALFWDGDNGLMIPCAFFGGMIVNAYLSKP